jgi:hypothetical protein
LRYSFGDEHINERIITAIKSNPSTYVCALYYDIVGSKEKKQYSLTESSPISKLAKENSKISVFGCRSAIIGCQFGTWKLKRVPDKDDTIRVSLCFSEDGCSNPNEELKGTGQWTGDCELRLPDFRYFIEFLQFMILPLNFGEEQK